eukprot:7061314-Prymnesium_polylepis.1
MASTATPPALTLLVRRTHTPPGTLSDKSPHRTRHKLLPRLNPTIQQSTHSIQPSNNPTLSGSHLEIERLGAAALNMACAPILIWHVPPS